jgi:hypothetical protein
MDRESLERLHFDRRLQNRRGWLAPGELERHVEALPDVSDKLTTLADQEAAGQAPAAEGGAEGSQGR